MGAADIVIDEIQELLDAGYSMTKTALLLNLDHKQVGRAFKKYNLEIYTPFDDEEDKKHLHQNFEWLWEEDKLESIGDSIFNIGKYKIPASKTEDDIVISKYCIKKYGSLLGYLKQKNLSLFIKSVFKNCINCKKFISINGFHKTRVPLWG